MRGPPCASYAGSAPFFWRSAYPLGRRISGKVKAFIKSWTDRFFNGDVANDNADGNFNATAGQAVHGGDFKDIEQKLDYIKALGATAIWISPVVNNGNGDYRGYAGNDFANVARHFGSLANLQHLRFCAQQGLLVIDDIVVNHGAQLLNSNDSGYPNFETAPGYNLIRASMVSA